MFKLFISYRRDDTLEICGRISDRLRQKFGHGFVSVDIDTIPPGVDFRDYIAGSIQGCDALLVLIGSRWLATSSNATNRLFEVGDVVRMELELALSLDIPVIPILVGSTALPAENALPASLQALRSKNILRVDPGADFHHHLDRLIARLGEIRRTKNQGANELPAPISAPPTHPSTARVPGGSDAPYRAAATKRRGSYDPYIHPTIANGITISICLLVLNSLLAALGSLLWSQLHYWPAFMVSALACSLLGWWGVGVAILSPVLSSLLHIGGAPAYLYVPVNALQAILVLLMFRAFRIDPSLARLADKAKYLILAVAVPSAVGALFAWALRRFTGVGANDPVLVEYAFYWTLENFAPAVFPGLWLHGVASSLARPFSWRRESLLSGIIGGIARHFEHVVPTVVTLLLAMALPIALVVGESHTAPNSPEAWDAARLLVSQNPFFRWLVLCAMVFTLLSIGFSLRHIRQSWTLEEAIKRHARSPVEAARILEGRQGATGRRPAIIISFVISNFGEVSRQLPPTRVTLWVNAIIQAIVSDAAPYECEVTHISVPTVTMMHALDRASTDPRAAFLYVLEVMYKLSGVSQSLNEAGLPSPTVSCGMHAGFVVFGDIGAGDAKQSYVIGEPVTVAGEIANDFGRGLPEPNASVVVSSACLRDAGLSALNPLHLGLTEARRWREDGIDSVQLYEVIDPVKLKHTIVRTLGDEKKFER